MDELIAHLIGDYVFQNHAMATNKVKSWRWAALHVALYMLPFLFVTQSPAALAVMAGTHLVIDRFRLARYWVAFWGVGCEGWVARAIRVERRRIFIRPLHDDRTPFGRDEEWAATIFDEAHPPPAPAPDFLAVWLLILVDNTAHLLINHLAILWL